MVIDNEIILNVKWEDKSEQVIGIPVEIYNIDQNNGFRTKYVIDYISNKFDKKVIEWGNY